MTQLTIEITLCRMFMEHIFHSVSKYRSPMPVLRNGSSRRLAGSDSKGRAQLFSLLGLRFVLIERR